MSLLVEINQRPLEQARLDALKAEQRAGLTNRQKVVQLRREHPSISQAEIARRLGTVTRERVRQILLTEGLPAVVKPPPIMNTCRHCEKEFVVKPYLSKSKIFCDKHCQTLYSWGLYPCDVCGDDVAIRHAEYKIRRTRNRTFTCGHACRATSIGAQSATLWKLHRQHIGTRELNSTTRDIPLELRKEYGLGKPTYLELRTLRRND